MKMLIASILVLIAVASAQDQKKKEVLQCNPPNAEVPEDWKDMSAGCYGEVRRQIQEEIDASMQYLAMGAYFAQDTVNRPGFSEFFFKAAAEEREHSHKLIEYLLMRGNLTGDITGLITINLPPKTTWADGNSALKDALAKETYVTKSIKRVIAQCEDDIVDGVKDNQPIKVHVNDYHLVDYLTGVYLEEQYHGQRDLAGKISTLDKLMKSHGPLGEFLFDKKLLE